MFCFLQGSFFQFFFRSVAREPSLATQWKAWQSISSLVLQSAIHWNNLDSISWSIYFFQPHSRWRFQVSNMYFLCSPLLGRKIIQFHQYFSHRLKTPTSFPFCIPVFTGFFYLGNDRPAPVGHGGEVSGSNRQVTMRQCSWRHFWEMCGEWPVGEDEDLRMISGMTSWDHDIRWIMFLAVMNGVEWRWRKEEW